MKVLVKSAKVVDNESPHNNKIIDILIEDGIITDIGSPLKVKRVDQEISFENLHVSQGWFDSSVSFGEPGYEERENIQNGLMVAGRSGFTSIALNPGTFPVTDNKAAVNFLINRSWDSVVNLYPIGALTVSSKGEDLAELFDMQQAGAVAFGDYKKAVSHPNLLKLALQYSQNFDGLVQSFPQENKIAGSGQMNEGKMSTSLGLKGIPALAEELQIVRDLHILEYTGGKLHVPTISTARSVELIRQAKENGLDVSCSVAIHHLICTDEALNEFDTNAKLLPPLRTKADIKALIAGIKDGTIDMVTSDHCPIDIEHKKVEFDNAMYGSLGLESAFGALLKAVPLKTAIKMLLGGKSRFNLPEEFIDVGSVANFTFFNPEMEYTLGLSDIQSTSKNSLFLGQELKGKVLGVFAKGRFLGS